MLPDDVKIRESTLFPYQNLSSSTCCYYWRIYSSRSVASNKKTKIGLEIEKKVQTYDFI